MINVPHEEKLAVEYITSLQASGMVTRNIHKRVHAIKAYLNWCKSNRVDPLRATATQLQDFIGRKTWRPSGNGERGGGPTRRNGVDKQRDEIKALRGWFKWMNAEALVDAATHLRTVGKLPISNLAPLRRVPKSSRKGPDQGKGPTVDEEIPGISILPTRGRPAVTG